MVVRNSWVTQGSGSAAGFFDHADIETIKRSTPAQVKRWIDGQLDGAAVTCVLIGPDTASRPFVQYEIERSAKEGKGLLGVYVHNIRALNQKPFGLLNWPSPGPNPFDRVVDPKPNGLLAALGFESKLSDRVRTYDWVNDDGYNNFSSWVERAALEAGR
jgi:hypothetical protein